MRGRVGRRLEAGEVLTGAERHDRNVLGGDGVARDPAGLDHDNTGESVNATDVTEAQPDEAGRSKPAIGLGNRLTQVFAHPTSSRSCQSHVPWWTSDRWSS